MQRRDLGFGVLCVSTLGAMSLPVFAQEGDIDVLIVGAGIAGLAAAISAKEAGATKVEIWEKGPLIGGHSIYSSGSLAVVSPKRIPGQKRDEGIEEYVEDARRLGGDINEAVIRHVAEHSESMLEWLEHYGVKFSSRVFQAQADIRYRSFAAMGRAAGREYVLKLAEAVKAKEVPVHLQARVTDIEKHASGGWRVIIEQGGHLMERRAKSVILATGGFTANIERRMRYDARLDASFTTSANPYGLYYDGATGDGLDMAERLGAELVNMASMQFLSHAGGRLLEYAGADIYVDASGHRFTAEDASGDVVAQAIFALPERRMWVITDSQSTKGATLGLKLALGTVHKARTISDMAVAMGVPTETLQATIREYNEAVKLGVDERFHKSAMLQTIEIPPFYWGEEHLSVHTTLGGVRTNVKAQVLRHNGSAIENLYVAGECAGGIFGRNRLGGMLLTASLVMGRTAGEQAVKNRR